MPADRYRLYSEVDLELVVDDMARQAAAFLDATPTVLLGMRRRGAPLADRLHATEVRAALTIHVAFSPERVDPANKTHGVENTPKVVGGVDVTATRLAAAFYSRFVPKVVPVSSASAAVSRPSRSS